MNSGQWRYPRGVIDPPEPIALPGGPLQLHERGVWDPAAQYWGEPEDTIAASIAQVIAGGPRMEFEFEQILPSHGGPDHDDAIIEAMELRDRGDAAAAIELLGGLLERDARCLDAYAHLGLLAFNAGDTQLALSSPITSAIVLAVSRARRTASWSIRYELWDAELASRERDAFLGDLTAWLRAEHAQTLEDAGTQTTLIRMLGGVSGRGMSMVWALNDYLPADGGPTLMERYIARPELGPSARAIARGLAEARLDVYRVRAVTPGVCLELESLSDNTSVRVAWRDGVEHFLIAEILVARVVDATAAPTLWGPGTRFPADGERRWGARLAVLPADPAQAALTILGFHPDDAAEPLPDGVDLHTMAWSIKDDERVLEVIEDDELWECLGEAIPTGWVFAWPDEATAGVTDLGGWREEAGEIEAARLIIREQDLTVLSADRGTLDEIAFLLEANLGELIVPRRESLAA